MDEVDDASRCERAADDPIRVGRHCDVLGAGYEASAEMLDWHLSRLNPIPGGVTPTRADRARGPVIALIDSGVQRGLEISDFEVDGTAASATPPNHPHGSLLAAMMLQLDPQAKIVSFRALGGADSPPGLGRPNDFARAIEQVLFHNADTRNTPTILNLSVGWPAELSRPRMVRGIRRRPDPLTGQWGHAPDAEAICRTVEDGPGGALRYALAMAYHAHEVGGPPMVIVGAGGNRPVGQRPDAPGLARTLGHVDCRSGEVDPRVREAWCDGDTPKSEANLYLPALWGHEGVAYNPWRPHACAEAVVPARVIEPIRPSASPTSSFCAISSRWISCTCCAVGTNGVPLPRPTGGAPARRVVK